MTEQGNFRIGWCCFKKGNPAQHMPLIHCQIIPFVKTRIFLTFPLGDGITAGHEVKSRTTTLQFVLEQLKTKYCMILLFLYFVYSLWVVKFNHRGKKYSTVFDLNSPDSVPYTSSRCAVQQPDHKYPQSRDLWRAEWGGQERWTHLFCPHQH